MEVVAEVGGVETWRGFGWPNRVTVKWVAGTTQITAVGEMDDTGPHLTEVTMTGPGITADVLRGPVLSVFREAVAQAATEPRAHGEGFASKTGRKRRVPVNAGAGRNVRSAVNRLGEVARVASAAPVGFQTMTVAEWFGVTPGYARQLVHQARQAGWTIGHSHEDAPQRSETTSGR